jgi:sporulation protein YlmC with PRC-barrel domain
MAPSGRKPEIRSGGYAAGPGVKRFATELRGKTVMTEDGQVLGVLDDFLYDTRTGRIQSLLVRPAESVERRLFKTDPEGRLVLNFRSMKAVKDVIVTRLGD